MCDARMQVGYILARIYILYVKVGRKKYDNRYFFKKYGKTVDEQKKSAIIYCSAKKYPISCIKHNLQLEGGKV